MLNSGEKFILSQLTRLRGNKPEHTISGPTKSTCLLTAEFLRERLTWVFSEPGLIISVLTIKNVQLEENLDLRGVTTKSAVVFLDCQLQGLQLSDSSIRSLYFRGGKIGRIEAVRTRLTGSFDLNPESGTGSKPHQACSRCTHVAEGIELSGAEIGGNLDLRGLDMTPRGQCENNIIDNFSLRADGIVVRGNVLLSRGFKASSAVRLNGCFIGRDLDFSGSEVTCLGDYAISLAGGHVKGNLRFSRTAEIRSKTEGTVRLSNATVDGTLDFSYLTCSASRNENQRHHVGVKLGEEYCYALNAQGVTVGGALRLDELVSQGPLNFINATIRGGITGTGMKIHFPMAHAFLADNAKVTGSVYLNSLETSGILRFVQSDLSGGLYLRNIVFLPPEYEGDVEGLRPTRLRNWRKAMRGLVADRATITGGFELEHVNAHKFDRAVSRLTLEGAKIPGIDKKTLDSFKKFDYVHLLNCEYSSIITHERLSSQDPPTSPSWRSSFQFFSLPCQGGGRRAARQ
jgi:cytoskeletal protein CcmA (bactofilin family)